MFVERRSASSVVVFPRQRRKEGRNRCLLTGHLAHDAGRFSVACTIRNLSPSGARIRLAGMTPLPKAAFMLLVRDATVYEADVCWMRDLDAGLSFRARHSLHGDKGPELEQLRRIWKARAQQ